MYLIAIAWIYVVLMMAVAEATSSTGSLLGALVTFTLYGVLPLGILLYIMRAPHRARMSKAREAAANTTTRDDENPPGSEPPGAG